MNRIDELKLEIERLKTLLKQELRVSIDVDETLVLYNLEFYDYPNSRIQFVDFDYYGQPRRLAVHKEHVELLKSYKARGYHITVHSNNGKIWADEVVDKLGLRSFVDETKTKDLKLVDEKPIDKALGQRVYIDFSNPYTWDSK